MWLTQLSSGIAKSIAKNSKQSTKQDIALTKLEIQQDHMRQMLALRTRALNLQERKQQVKDNEHVINSLVEQQHKSNQQINKLLNETQVLTTIIEVQEIEKNIFKQVLKTLK